MQFQDIAIGSKFLCNSSLYVKKSSRTAVLLTNGRRYYFKKGETCSVVL